MSYFLVYIDNRQFYEEQESPINPDPRTRWPWLDPFWGVVEEIIEGVQTRDCSAKTAEMIVKASEDFLVTWPLGEEILTGVYANGQMVVDHEGTIFHVAFEKLTELKGGFAHDLFAQPVPHRIDDFDSELLSRTENHLAEDIKEELSTLGHEVGETDIWAAVTKSLEGVDLLTADYDEIYACIDRAQRLLAVEYLISEDPL